MNIAQVYDEIERQYDYQRQENLRIQLERKRQISEKIPALKELVDQNRSASLALLMRKMEQEEGIEEESLSPEQLKNKKAELLRKNGFPEDYLEPVFSCKECEDTGYLRDSYGARTIRCGCFSKRLTQRLSEVSGLQGLLKTENFENLSERFYEGDDLDNFKRCEKLCREFVSNSSESCQNFLFYGNIGTGKSFLSCCIAAELLKQGKSVFYFSSADLFDRLADVKFSEYGERYGQKDLQYDLYESDLLILDDLGTERVNQFILSELFTLINERIRKGRSTIISTNLTLQNLSDIYSERILSRITSNYTLCKLTGKDIRLEKVRMRSQKQPS